MVLGYHFFFRQQNPILGQTGNEGDNMERHQFSKDCRIFFSIFSRGRCLYSDSQNVLFFLGDWAGNPDIWSQNSGLRSGIDLDLQTDMDNIDIIWKLMKIPTYIH